MNVKDTFASQVSQLRTLCPPIEAFGVGGSIGRGQDDRFSDIDFFLLCPTDKFFDFLTHFTSDIRHLAPVISYSGLVLNPGFGFAHSYILANGVSVEYNINCRDSLDMNPMRQATRVIYDSTGFFTRFVTEASENAHACMERSIARALHDYLARLLKLRKAAYRNELLPLAYHIVKLRLVLIGLDRVRLQGQPYQAFQADARVALHLGEAYHAFLLRILPGLDAKSILVAFEQLRTAIHDSLHHSAPEALSVSGFWQLEATLAVDIARHLREMQ